MRLRVGCCGSGTWAPMQKVAAGWGRRLGRVAALPLPWSTDLACSAEQGSRRGLTGQFGERSVMSVREG